MPKRITWIINDITQVGGIERVVCNVSNFLLNAGYSLKIVSLNTQKGKPHFNLDKKVKIEHLNYPESENTNRKQLKNTLRSFLEAENGQSDVIITCHPWIAVPILQQKRLFHGKIISTEHATWEYHSKARRALNVIYYRRAKRFVLLTDHAQKIYKKYGFKNTVVIPNFISDYPSKTASLKSTELIAAGRLTDVKGYDRLIQAIAIIKDQFSPWHLTIYGDGENRAALETLIKDNSLEGLVSIEHFTDQLQDKLLDSSGFILSSHNEAFPMVSLEALSCGVPIISYDIPSLREIDNHTDTIIFAEQNNIKDLAIKLSLYISSKDRADRGKASRKLSQDYSLERIGERWIKLIESL